MWLDKLRELKTESKMTYRDIAEKTGIPLTTIEKLFAGRTQEPRFTMVTEIARAMGGTLDDTGITRKEMETLMRLRELDLPGLKRVDQAIECELQRVHAKAVPYARLYYDFPVSAGTGEFLDDRTVSIVTLSDEPPLGTDYILRISGDSMEPKFSDGDFVYVNRTNRIDYGEVGIFAVCGSVYIKEYTYRGLKSFNKKYKPIPPDSDIHCLGRVLGKLTGKLKKNP